MARTKTANGESRARKLASERRTEPSPRRAPWRLLRDNVPRSLAVRAIVLIVCVEVLVVGVIAGYFVHVIEAEMDLRLRETVSRPGMLMQEGLLKYAVVEDRPMMLRLVGGELHDGLVVGANGTIFHSLDRSLIGRTIDQVPRLKSEWFDPSTARNVLATGVAGDRQILISVTPIMLFDGAKPFFFLYLSIDTTDTATQRATLRWIAAGAVLLCVVLTSGFLYLGLRHLFLEPLGRIRTFIADVAGARHTESLHPHGPGELGELERNLENMAMAVRDNRARIVAFNQELERRIEARTHDLVEEMESHKRTAEALRQANDDVEKASRDKSQFISTASHDLRQPLQALALLIGALAVNESEPLKLRLIRRCHDSMKTVTDLLNAVLDLSKLDSGQIEPTIETVAIGDMFERLNNEFQAEANARQLSLRMMPTSARTCSDPVLLETILRNLIQNAVRHTSRGGVLVGCRRRAGALSLEVWDSGPGIPDERLRDIFREFVQIGNQERNRAKGLGLGLSIVDRLSRLLGHRVTVRSRIGRGSVFSIDVPLETSSCGSLRAAPSSDTVADPPVGCRIALIEDDETVADATASLLTQHGHRVVMAIGDASRLDGLVASFDAPPDIVISDYRLPNGITGVDAIEALRARFQTPIPAIIITGDTSPDILASLHRSRLPILYKPVQTDDLLDTLRLALSTSATTRPRSPDTPGTDPNPAASRVAQTLGDPGGS